MSNLVNRNSIYSQYLLWIVIAIIALTWLIPFSSVIKRNFDNMVLVKNLSYSPFEYLLRVDQIVMEDHIKTGDVTWRFKLIDNYDSRVEDTVNPPKYTVHNIMVPKEREDLYWLAKGGLDYLSGNQEDALNAWKYKPEISRYLIGLSSKAPNSEYAKSLLELSISVQPTSMAYYQLGMKYLDSGEESLAITMFEQGVGWAGSEINNEFQARILLEIGNIYLSQRMDELALKYYNLAQNVRGYLSSSESVMLARAHIKLNQYEEAYEILTMLIQRDPDSSKAWWWLGEMERERGNLELSRDAYREFQKLNPDNTLVVERLNLLDQLQE